MQGLPSTVNAVGATAPPDAVARKPTVAVPPAGTAPQDGDVTVTERPDWLAVPPHSWVTVWSVGKVQRSVHTGHAAAPRFRTVIDAEYPPDHCEFTW